MLDTFQLEITDICKVYMSSKRYPEEFKIEDVNQVTERGHSITEVSSRLGTITHSLYMRGLKIWL